MKLEKKTVRNKSGIFPCGNHVLVKPDAIEEKTKDGIVIPESVRKRHQLSVAYGYVVALGPDCFIHSVTTKKSKRASGGWEEIEITTIAYSGSFAIVGDRISFAIHSGRNYIGEDGELYVQMNDTDITALVTKGVTATSLEAREPF